MKTICPSLDTPFNDEIIFNDLVVQVVVWSGLVCPNCAHTSLRREVQPSNAEN